MVFLVFTFLYQTTFSSIMYNVVFWQVLWLYVQPVLIMTSLRSQLGSSQMLLFLSLILTSKDAVDGLHIDISLYFCMYVRKMLDFQWTLTAHKMLIPYKIPPFCMCWQLYNIINVQWRCPRHLQRFTLFFWIFSFPFWISDVRSKAFQAVDQFLQIVKQTYEKVCFPSCAFFPCHICI